MNLRGRNLLFIAAAIARGEVKPSPKLTEAQREALQTGRCFLTGVIESLVRAGLCVRIGPGRVEPTPAGRAALKGVCP